MSGRDRELLLVVDDLETARYAKSRVLRNAGYDVIEAGTAADALRLVRELRPRLVVLDVKLPDGSGWEVCRTIKSEPATAGVLVLQISATFVAGADTVRSLEEGADGCLTEPLDATVFVATVRALLRARIAEDALREALARELSAREAADAANRAKDEFLAMLSHELRTPLSAILTWGVLLREKDLSPRERERAMDAIVRNATLQVRLIDDLLDVSRVISGKMRLELALVPLGEVAEAALESVRPEAEAREIRLRHSIDPGLAPVHGDASRLQQVVWNLLSNAIKFTPAKGQVSLAVRAAGAHAEIEVADTGRGIDPGFLPFIFERFRQADSSPARLTGGLGLGLAIVRHLVELHGGSVEAHSDGIGRGARFRVRLPVSSERQRPEFAIETIDWTPDPGVRLDGTRVLLVDDEADARDAVALLLRRAGADVVACPGVTCAVQACAERMPHVVVSDIAMPGEDGYALIRQLRARPPGQGGTVPAIALTAFGGPHDVERILSAGFSAYLRKPVDAVHLISTVHQLATSPQAT